MVKLLPYLKQNRKGQGIVEYALLLAFIVGIAVMLQGVGLKDAVVGVFDNVVMVLGGGKENKYVTAFKKWGTMDYDELVNESKSARIAADMDGLTNIAAYFNSLETLIKVSRELRCFNIGEQRVMRTPCRKLEMQVRLIGCNRIMILVMINHIPAIGVA